MPIPFTAAQIEQFKLEAKIVSRGSAITRTNALDQIANSQGFSTWALLSKHATPVEAPTLAPKYYRFTRNLDGMRAAMRKIDRADGNSHDLAEVAKSQVSDIWKEFGSPRNALDFTVAYVSAALEVPRFSISSASTAYWEMRLWLPYTAGDVGNGKQILLNRHYKPVGLNTDEHVGYEDYGNHHLKLTQGQLAAIAHARDADGYLYGMSPWSSRKNAGTYLRRLEKLQGFLQA